MMKRKLAVPLSLILLFMCGLPGQAQVDSLAIIGQYGPVVHLSAGAASGGGGLTATVANSTTGATSNGSPLDVETFNFNIDFGDLARGDGNPVVSTVGLRLRSNTSFKLVASVLSFSSTPLIYQERPIGGNDGGSFARFWVGPINATGAGATSNGITVNGALTGGIKLSDVTHGPITSNSTLICTGPAASQSGGVQSPSNAIDVPIFISVPTGYELGPAPGSARGSFNFSIQFAVYGGQ